jgi:hypothetical protein
MGMRFVGCLITVAAFMAAVRADPAATSAAASAPVLVELFTSEGCSSCPPADRLLNELRRGSAGGGVIVLSEHVDYWDHLGWRDPFSSPVFSARQQHYGQQFRLESVYTPNMVVDGFASFDGADGEQARKMIELAGRAKKAAVAVTRSNEEGGGSVRISARVEHLGAAQVDHADVYLAIAESDVRSRPFAGENVGRPLQHAGVVRRLMKVAEIDAKRGIYTADLRVKLESSWKRENVQAVVFVQDRASGRIVGAAACAL